MKILFFIVSLFYFTCFGLFAKAPNFLLLLADDMTWSDCSAYGSSQVKTPHMSRLAAEGMALDGMFTSTAMCAPTRQQLYTGLFPVRNGAYPNHSQVYKGVKSLPHYLAALGYRVGLIGKKHFGPSNSFPFEYIGGKSKGYQAIQKFIEQDPAQPYCLVVCSNSPHQPWIEGDKSLYPSEKIQVPPNLMDTPDTRNQLSKYYAEITDLDGELGKCMELVDESGEKENTVLMFTSEQGMALPLGGKWTCYDTGLKTAFIVRWPKKIKPASRSAALLQYVDVVPTLIEAAGGDPSTLEVGRSDTAGEKGFDGRSFLDVLTGERKKQRDYLYGVHTTNGIINGTLYPIRSVRGERYKLIKNLNHQSKFHNLYTKNGDQEGRYYQSYFIRLEKAAAKGAAIATRLTHFQSRPEEELYDIENDPYELTNLAERPGYDDIKAELRQKLASWMGQQGDSGMETESVAEERKRSKKSQKKKSSK